MGQIQSQGGKVISQMLGGGERRELELLMGKSQSFTVRPLYNNCFAMPKPGEGGEGPKEAGQRQMSMLVEPD